MKLKITKLLAFCNTVQSKILYLKNSLCFFVFLLSFITTVYSQNVGMNTTGAAPNSKALLDIDADNVTGEKKGLLIPRMTTSDRNTLSSSGTIPES